LYELSFCVQQEEQLKSALKEAEGQVKLLTSRCTKATQELEMAQKWKDELDVLRPQAAAKDRLDTQIEKYKKKLETFDEMKATMKRLEGTNAELIARNLDLEREASKVAPLRSQLEDVRDSKIMSVRGAPPAPACIRNVESMCQMACMWVCNVGGNCLQDVRISELELALAQAKGAADEYKAALQAATERAAVEWQQPSVEVMSLEQLTPSAPASSLADGVNDFNPAVAERLARLERENTELRASADSNTLTRLDEMEKNLDETKRMKAVFESRYYAVRKGVEHCM
jgi:DNA repair ATPase RecN